MSQQISLKEAERKAFKTKVDDGLWDILLGSYFLMFVIAIYLSPSLGDFWSSAIFIPGLGLVYLVIWVIRKYIVTPRIGRVKFGRGRQARLMRFTMVMLAINIIAFILGIVASLTFGKFPGQAFTAFFGLMLLMAFSIGAYFLDIVRFYIYGLLVGLGPMLGEWLWNQGYVAHHGIPIIFGSAAGIMIIVGLVVFFRLIHDNPVLEDGLSVEDN